MHVGKIPAQLCLITSAPKVQVLGDEEAASPVVSHADDFWNSQRCSVCTVQPQSHRLLIRLLLNVNMPEGMLEGSKHYTAVTGDLHTTGDAISRTIHHLQRLGFPSKHGLGRLP
jgi:hypothetical protein